MTTPTTPANPVQAINAAYRRGDVEQALALALAVEQVALAAPDDCSAHAVRCEVLQRSGRITELSEFLDLAGAVGRLKALLAAGCAPPCA